MPLLTGLWWWALVGGVRRPLLAAAAISLAYAATDEYHQTFVDGRHGSPLDVGIDAIGDRARLPRDPPALAAPEGGPSRA